MNPNPTPVLARYRKSTADRAWAYIMAYVREQGEFPDQTDIGRHLGRNGRSQWAGDVLHTLLCRGLVCCRPRGRSKNGRATRYEWSLTQFGDFEIERAAEAAKQAEPSEATASGGAGGSNGVTESPAMHRKKSRKVSSKPRRAGSPKRVPHKPTAAHRKPSRQQRRETERTRELTA
jgi:hypothetical protein